MLETCTTFSSPVTSQHEWIMFKCQKNSTKSSHWKTKTRHLVRRLMLLQLFADSSKLNLDSDPRSSFGSWDQLGSILIQGRVQSKAQSPVLRVTSSSSAKRINKQVDCISITHNKPSCELWELQRKSESREACDCQLKATADGSKNGNADFFELWDHWWVPWEEDQVNKANDKQGRRRRIFGAILLSVSLSLTHTRTMRQCVMDLASH